MQDYAEIWQAADKIVYSKTLRAVQRQDPDRARVRPRGGPAAEGDGRRDITVGGPHLAAQAIEAGLVDEYQLFFVPVVVGGGKRLLPGNDVG